MHMAHGQVGEVSGIPSSQGLVLIVLLLLLKHKLASSIST